MEEYMMKKALLCGLHCKKPNSLGLNGSSQGPFAANCRICQHKVTARKLEAVLAETARPVDSEAPLNAPPKVLPLAGTSTPCQARKPLSFPSLKLSDPSENAPKLNAPQKPALPTNEAKVQSSTTRVPTPDSFRIESVVKVKESYVELKSENETLHLQCAQFMDTRSNLQEEIQALKAQVTSTKKKKPEKKKPEKISSAEKTGPLKTSLVM